MISSESISGIEILLYKKIPMKDGIDLSGKVYKKAGVEKMHAILFLTPYVADEYHNEAIQFAEQNYAYVIVDVRGRGDSEGEFFPLEQDGKDGSQIIEWIASQDWSDGRVAMMGGSYRGMVQWQTLMHKPKALKIISPAASVAPGIDYPNPKNIFYSFTARWLAYVSGNTRCDKLFNDNNYWNSKFYNLYSEGIAFQNLDSISGIPQNIFQRWLLHPEYDDYWKAMTPKKEDYEAFDIPILTTTGYFDDDQHGAMHYYFNHFKYGNIESLKNHFLLIGPWDHSGTRVPQRHLAGLEFEPESVIDMSQLHIALFDWFFRGAKMPKILKKRVNFYLMGHGKWLHSDSIDDLSIETKIFYLSSEDGKANDLFNSGFLKDSLQNCPPDVINYDPLDIMTREEYYKQVNSNTRYTDQYMAYQECILVYHSDKLNEPLRIAGYLNLKLYIETNVPDIDFISYFYEIKPDGTSIYLTESFLRARYRNSLEKPELLSPNEVNLFNFKAYYFFARELEIGSRIRIIIKPLNTPEYQKNYCSGGEVSKESKTDARESMISLYHDKNYPSCLELPLLNSNLLD